MSLLARWSLVLVVAAIVAILTAHWLNHPAKWRPLVIVSSGDNPVAAKVSLQEGTGYEVALEFERGTTGAIGKQLLTPRPQTAVVGRWSIACQNGQIAAGDATDYIRIETVASWRGEFYRAIARVPFGVDEAKYRTFGLAGRYLSERVVGAFRIVDTTTEPCDFTWMADQSMKDIRVVVRKSDNEWRAHSRQLGFLPFAGALALLLGSLAALAWGIIVRRSARSGSSTEQH